MTASATDVSNVVEWDMDDDGLACAVTAEGERWFCLQIPVDVTGNKYLEMQEDLRRVARKFSCA